VKKTLLLPLLFIIIIGCLSAFSYSSLGDNEVNNSKNIEDTIKVPYEDVVIKCSSGECRKCIITNEQDYQALLKYRSAHPDCMDYKLPSIDFTKYTLIGQAITVGGCKRPDSYKEVVKIPSQKKYILEARVQQYGMCKTGLKVKIWIIIPKIESDYTVEYNTTYNLNQEK
jgi:hypothetical protein